MTKTDFLEIRSKDAASVLESIIYRLSADYEEFLRREIVFVQQCYAAGKLVWWRKYLHIGFFIPSEDVIKDCILNNKQPPFWLCLNRRIIPIASKHFQGRVKNLNDDLAYAKHLLQQCERHEYIEVYSGFAARFKLRVT